MTQALGRRQVLTGTAAIAVGVTSRAAALEARASRRQVLSFGLQSAGTVRAIVDRITTFFLTIPLETQVEELRVGVMNITPEPYGLDGICCCEGTLFEPTPGSKWAYFSFGNEGDRACAPAQRPQPCIVPGNRPADTGALNVPRICWSDWMSYETHAASGRPQMLFRVLVPPQRMCLTQSVVCGDLGRLVPGLRSWTLGQWRMPGDFVTEPVKLTRQPQGAGAAPLYVVQYRAATPGLQLVIGGDSQVSNWHNFARLAAIMLSTPTHPISTWNAAWGGQPVQTFWPCLQEAIETGRPSLCLIEGWTGHAAFNRERELAYEALGRWGAERVAQQGGIPIVMKALPLHLFGRPTLLADWQHDDRELDNLVPGAVLFDPAPYIQSPTQPGSWREDASDDGLHANLHGEILLCDAFEKLLCDLV